MTTTSPRVVGSGRTPRLNGTDTRVEVLASRGIPLPRIRTGVKCVLFCLNLQVLTEFRTYEAEVPPARSRYTLVSLLRHSSVVLLAGPVSWTCVRRKES